MIQTNTTQMLFTAGSLLAVLGCIIKFFDITYAPYVFSTGAVFLIYVQLKHLIDNRKSETREKRLSRNGMLSSLLLGLAAYFMFTGSNSWVVAVLIYALSSLFLSFRGNAK
ncbi:MAG TPA: hypothetical protein VFK73_01935 [Paludibacter sp.]|nr:hypothetical protein [Paludibacter sp.]